MIHKILFIISIFFIIGCSTPEIHIPSYTFASPRSQRNVAHPKAEATKVTSIEEDSEKNDIGTSLTPNHTPKTIVKKPAGFLSIFEAKPTIKNEYYTDGQIRSRLVMDDDSGESGLLYKYDYDGKIKSTVHIKHGLKNGLETLFDPKGVVLKRTPYVNDRKDGIVEVYYPDGKVLAQITYADNERHGRASKYTHDGDISKEVQYVHGEVAQNVKSEDIEIPVIN